MKSYYFISGLPRSGSTLLSAILRQNPDFYADIGTILPEVIENVTDTLTLTSHNTVIDESQRKNIIYGVFDGYYHNINKPIIFNSSRFWTRKTHLLKKLFPYTKIICTVRDIVSILNSFEIISAKNCLYTNTLVDNNKNVFSRCDGMMEKNNGVVGGPWVNLVDGLGANPDMIFLIEYEDLCKYPEKTIRNLYDFIEKPYYEHTFDNIKYSNETFDKSCNLIDLHTVKSKVEYNPPKFVLPNELIKKYSELNLEFWRREEYKKHNILNEKLFYT